MRFGTIRTIWFEGERYSFADKAAFLPDQEPLPSKQAAFILRRMNRANPRLLEELCQAFGYTAGPDAMLREIDQHASWSDGGLCRVEVFRRFPTLQSIPRRIEPRPLSELAPAHEVAPEHWVEVELHDREDNPMTGIPLEVALPTGRRRVGRTNRFGVFRIDGINKAGACTVVIAEPDDSDVPAEPAPAAGAVSFALHAADGSPYANLELSIELPDGSIRTVTTDDRGAAHVSEVPVGRCVVSMTGSAAEAEK